MGNRAVITTEPYSPDNLGVYVHWNGGKASIEGFLQAAKALGYRPPNNDYGWARLCQLIANYFGSDGLSVGVGKCRDLGADNGDNGTYLISGWEIVGREFFKGREEIDEDKTKEIRDACIASVIASDAVGALYELKAILDRKDKTDFDRLSDAQDRIKHALAPVAELIAKTEVAHKFEKA